jgi:O-antigen ligase
MSLGLVYIFWGMLQFFRGGEVAIFDFLKTSDFAWQAGGLFRSANHLTGFLEFIAIMSWSLVFWSRRRGWLKMVGAYIGVGAITAIIMTGNPGGYLSLIIGLCAFAGLSLIALRRTSHEKFNLALCGTILLGVISMVVVTGYVSRDVMMEHQVADVDGSTHTQWNLWQTGWQQYRESPVIGTGAGSYAYYGRQLRSPEFQGEPDHLHNDYLELLAEYGAVGGLLFLLALTAHARSGRKAMFSLLRGRHKRISRTQSEALA